MIQKCSICNHPKRQAIEEAIIANATLTEIAERYKVGIMSLSRHKRAHLLQSTIKTINKREETRANGIMDAIYNSYDKVNLLQEACDEYLRDPDNPDKYDIGPRDTDVTIIYSELGADGKKTRKKRKLSAILADVGELTATDTEIVEIKVADIRELILKTVSSCRELLGFIVDMQVLEHNIRVSEAFSQELFAYLDEHEAGLGRKFAQRLIDKKLIKDAVAIPERTGGHDEIEA